MAGIDQQRLDALTARARREREERERGYREQALNLFPWVCGRCGRSFTRTTIRELTVHHIDHDHHNNPADGSNWELLCLYCHDNEHQRGLEADAAPEEPTRTRAAKPGATHNPFADLGSLLGDQNDSN